MKAIIKNYEYRGRRFAIVAHENLYCAIEKTYIGSGGRMFTSRDFTECVERLTQGVDFDHLQKTGYTKAQALAKVFGLTEDMAQKLEQIL